MNWYPFHIGDYAKQTRHLSWDEDCAYRRLLDLYYGNESPLPDDERELYRKTLASTDQQRAAVMAVLREFWQRTDEGWVNRRADEEIATAREHQEKQRAKANKRWQMQRAEHGNAASMPQDTARDATAARRDAGAMPPSPSPSPSPSPLSTPEGVDTPRAARAVKFDALEHLVGMGADAAVAADWIALRKGKRLAVSATAIGIIEREARKAGWPITRALAECCARGWAGFNADWVSGRAPSVHDQRAATIAKLTGRDNHDHDPFTLDA